jgi:NarL family two-component system response regulator LiaR
MTGGPRGGHRVSATSDERTQPRIRVLIADDHAAIRRGIVAFMLAFDDLELAGDAASGQEAMDLCACAHPDVVLMGMTMPDMTGAAVTRAICHRWPSTRVIALSSFQEEEQVQEVLRAGAVGYLLKNVSANELAESIRAAYRREVVA